MESVVKGGEDADEIVDMVASKKQDEPNQSRRISLLNLKHTSRS